jgi:hypothetical protein
VAVACPAPDHDRHEEVPAMAKKKKGKKDKKSKKGKKK